MFRICNVIYCSKCGCTADAQAKQCAKCGQSTQLLAEIGSDGRPLPYASFAERLKAGVLDAVILSAIETPITVISSVLVGPSLHVLPTVLTVLITFGYYPGLESSRLQATLGKRIVGLKVTDLKGERISFLRAALKQLVQSVAGCVVFGGVIFVACSFLTWRGDNFLLIGASVLLANILYFSMHCAIVFSEKRQSVFDKMTGRLVLRRRKEVAVTSPKLIQ